MTYTMPRCAWLRRVLLEDVVLSCTVPLLAWLAPTSPLIVPLVITVPLVLLIRIVTLHFPDRVAIEDEAIAFGLYGRSHRFAWKEIERLRIRRFIVRDRVLVRISPSPPWRGRYWLTRDLEGFDKLLSALEARVVR
jgi:hypothetical protein